MEQNQLYTAMRFYFLYVDRYVFGAGWVFPDSHLPYAMVRYILRGSAEFVVDGRSFLVHEGQVVYLPDGCRLGCHTMDQIFEFYSIRFKSATQLGAEDLLRDHFHIRLVNDCAGDTSILSYFDQVYRSATSQNPGKAFRVRGNLELIIAWLVEQAGGQPARSSAVREDTPSTSATICTSTACPSRIPASAPWWTTSWTTLPSSSPPSPCAGPPT